MEEASDGGGTPYESTGQETDDRSPPGSVSGGNGGNGGYGGGDYDSSGGLTMQTLQPLLNAVSVQSLNFTKGDVTLSLQIPDGPAVKEFLTALMCATLALDSKAERISSEMSQALQIATVQIASRVDEIVGNATDRAQKEMKRMMDKQVDEMEKNVRSQLLSARHDVENESSRLEQRVRELLDSQKADMEDLQLRANSLALRLNDVEGNLEATAHDVQFQLDNVSQNILGFEEQFEELHLTVLPPIPDDGSLNGNGETADARPTDGAPNEGAVSGGVGGGEGADALTLGSNNPEETGGESGGGVDGSANDATATTATAPPTITTTPVTTDTLSGTQAIESPTAIATDARASTGPTPSSPSLGSTSRDLDSTEGNRRRLLMRGASSGGGSARNIQGQKRASGHRALNMDRKRASQQPRPKLTARQRWIEAIRKVRVQIRKQKNRAGVLRARSFQGQSLLQRLDGLEQHFFKEMERMRKMFSDHDSRVENMRKEIRDELHDTSGMDSLGRRIENVWQEVGGVRGELERVKHELEVKLGNAVGETNEVRKTLLGDVGLLEDKLRGLEVRLSSLTHEVSQVEAETTRALDKEQEDVKGVLAKFKGEVDGCTAALQKQFEEALKAQQDSHAGRMQEMQDEALRPLLTEMNRSRDEHENLLRARAEDLVQNVMESLASSEALMNDIKGLLENELASTVDNNGNGFKTAWVRLLENEPKFRYMRQRLSSIEAEGLVAGQELALIRQEVSALYNNGELPPIVAAEQQLEALLNHIQLCWEALSRYDKEVAEGWHSAFDHVTTAPELTTNLQPTAPSEELMKAIRRLEAAVEAKASAQQLREFVDANRLEITYVRDHVRDQLEASLARYDEQLQQKMDELYKRLQQAEPDLDTRLEGMVRKLMDLYMEKIAIEGERGGSSRERGLTNNDEELEKLDGEMRMLAEDVARLFEDKVDRGELAQSLSAWEQEMEERERKLRMALAMAADESSSDPPSLTPPALEVPKSPTAKQSTLLLAMNEIERVRQEMGDKADRKEVIEALGSKADKQEMEKRTEKIEAALFSKAEVLAVRELEAILQEFETDLYRLKTGDTDVTGKLRLQLEHMIKQAIASHMLRKASSNALGSLATTRELISHCISCARPSHPAKLGVCSMGEINNKFPSTATAKNKPSAWSYDVYRGGFRMPLKGLFSKRPWSYPQFGIYPKGDGTAMGAILTPVDHSRKNPKTAGVLAPALRRVSTSTTQRPLTVGSELGRRRSTSSSSSTASAAPPPSHAVNGPYVKPAWLQIAGRRSPVGHNKHRFAPTSTFKKLQALSQQVQAMNRRQSKQYGVKMDD